MIEEIFAQRAEELRPRLYRTALMYFGDAVRAEDVLDEALFRGLRGCRLLRREEFFSTWMTRILINECHRESRRMRRVQPMAELPEAAAEAFDALPLKEAIRRLPVELKEVVILRYFAGYTVQETAEALQIPQGTAASRQRRALKLLRLELGEEDEA